MGSAEFSPLWAGQAAALMREMGAGELTRWLAAEAEERLGSSLAGPWLERRNPSQR
jgi:nitronate monooxygenase